MSRENVEIVRSIWTAWEQGDLRSVEWASRTVEYVIGDGPIPGEWMGLAEMAKAGRENVEAWDDLRFDVEEYRALDEERVLVLYRYTGRGRKSGVELAQLRSEGVGLFHVRGGKVTRVVQYWNRERGLADLGLTADAGVRE